jgi:hypothetical protein
MLQTYFQVLPVLDSCNFEASTRVLFLSGADTEDARELLEILKVVESVSKSLQKEDTTRNNLYTARLLFDNLINDLPGLNLAPQLGPNAAIVHNKFFESAIVKLQAPIEVRLTGAEAEAVKVFKIDASTAGADDEGKEEEGPVEGYAEKILREAAEKASKKQKKSEYRSVAHVASNSNRCERLFSSTKLVMTDQRKCMDPSTLEMITILDENSDLWDAYDVQEVGLALKRGGEGKEDEEEIEIAEYVSDSEDEDGRADVDLAVDINSADDI